MEKNLYIDASHPNETRVVLKSNGHIEDYEYEGVKNNLIKNNIYLGKVSRVEPSLQAAFIDFGRDRHAEHLARRGYWYRRVHHAWHPTLSAHALLGNHALLPSAGR